MTARRADFRICHVSIQATHVHLLVEADDRMALARGMQGFQIACARRFNQLQLRARRGAGRENARGAARGAVHAPVRAPASGRRPTRPAPRHPGSGPVFADRYHPIPLSGPRRVRAALAYVLGNWRRHREDRGSAALLDPFSSAGAFGGWAGALRARLGPHSEPLPVCFPTTWLLAAGWRRAGPPPSPRARPGPAAA